MGILSRLFSIFKAKANKAIDAIEDKIELLEQKVRELEQSHKDSMNSLAKVKALEIKMRGDAEKFRTEAQTYLDKATQLKAKLKAGDIEEEEGKTYILSMLNKHENMLNEAKAKEEQGVRQAEICKNLEKKIKDLTNLISTTKNNITNIKAQSEAAKVNKEVSKELSNVNVDGVSGQIEAIQKQIVQDNAEAEAWVKLDENLEGDDAKIDKILNNPSPTENSKLLSDFMKD